MNLHHGFSRRTLVRAGAVGAVLVASPMLARTVLAQNGDIELVCTSDGVRIRDDYGLDSTVLGYVNTGDVVNQIGDSVEADGYVWIPVSVQRDRSLTGWAAAMFFERAGGSTGWEPGTAVHVNDNDVNLRTGPGLGNRVVAVYDAGTNATVLSGPTSANDYDWYEIEVADGTVGWMASAFLSPGHSNNGSGWPAGTEVHVNDNDVNVRDAPGLDSTVIAVLDSGTNLVIMGGPQAADGYDWYNVSLVDLQGTTGWMAAQFLSEGHVGDGSGWQPGAYVRTTTDLNLRSGPGTGYGVIRTYPTGEVATVISGPTAANGYSWYEVETWSDGNVGWFAGEFLETARFEPTGSRLEVVDGPLNLRRDPDTSAPIVASLATGEVVVIRDASFVSNDGYTWANVYVEENPDLVGWVAREFTEEIR